MSQIGSLVNEPIISSSTMFQIIVGPQPRVPLLTSHSSIGLNLESRSAEVRA